MSSRGLLKEIQGTVVSDKMQKTVVVQVEAHVKHPKYGKYYTRRSKFSAHDESNTAALGDLVLVKESRPLSKTKRWAVIKIVKKAPVDILLAEPAVVAKQAIAKKVSTKVVKKKGATA